MLRYLSMLNVSSARVTAIWRAVKCHRLERTWHAAARLERILPWTLGHHEGQLAI